MNEAVQESVARTEGLNGEVAVTGREAAEERQGEREQEFSREKRGQSPRENARMKMRRLESEVRQAREELEEARRAGGGIRADMGAEASAREALGRENAAWRERARERLLKDDLDEIVKAYPDEQAGDVRELGEDFLRLRAAGVGAIPAYAAIREAGRRRNAGPPSTGPVSASLPGEGEYFSSRELDQLSERDLRDPALFQKAVRSMRLLSKHTLNRRK